MINSEEESIHYKTVYRILPEFAKQLKKEGVISDWDRKQFKVELVKNWEPIRANPDLTLHVLGRGSVVVEIVNPKVNLRGLWESWFTPIFWEILEEFKQLCSRFCILNAESLRGL